MAIVSVIVGTLAVWRATHLLQAEDGPWGIFVRIRRLAGSGFWGELLDCFYCRNSLDVDPGGSHNRDELAGGVSPALAGALRRGHPAGARHDPGARLC